MLACDSNAVSSWSKKRMEELESVRTIECLRGRLLAERAATKSARHEAQLMENKVSELENKVREETEYKNKAEKKLKYLLNKLQSLKIDYALEDSENYRSREFITDQEDAKEYRIKESIPASCGKTKVEAQVFGGCRSGSSNNSEDGSSTITTNSEPNVQNGSAEKLLVLKSNRSFDGADGDDDDQRTDQIKSSKEQVVAKMSKEQDADNSLALVPVLRTASSEKIDGNHHNETVSKALNELRRARDEIERSMERRREIKVRWAQLLCS